ncbi:MAG: carboxypeptidase regulatory-like domain-containing protein [Gemmatimonadaceae bacterium]|nr:carboxypeptidase regulatory-like domain-containing protein [Gemmatimonadaceae bacterium]
MFKIQARRSGARAAEPARDSAPAVAMADVASAADSAATSAESAAGFAGRAPRQLPESVAASQPAPLMAKLAQRPAQGASAGADSALAPGVGAVVRGRVRSNDGEPISGASVAIGQVATFTQNDGTYILALPSTLVSDQPAVLRVRRIGYHAAADSLRLGSGRTITHDVTLTGQASMLSEVVVTRDDDARTARLRVSSPQRPQITLVRSDSVREGGRTVRRKIYEVRPGVRVTLAEAAMIADHQAPVDGRRAPVPAAVSPESSAVGVSSIQWTSDDGTECTLSGRLSIAELRKLKELLH